MLAVETEAAEAPQRMYYLGSGAVRGRGPSGGQQQNLVILENSRLDEVINIHG